MSVVVMAGSTGCVSSRLSLRGGIGYIRVSKLLDYQYWKEEEQVSRIGRSRMMHLECPTVFGGNDDGRKREGVAQPWLTDA